LRFKRLSLNELVMRSSYWGILDLEVEGSSLEPGILSGLTPNATRLTKKINKNRERK
jgi:hypothetical protein